ncbi:MAG TPA: hypothetical protein VHS06_11940 [Chloroflexota bacterium]|nr:hypothetical protein [Chloroflexota bacterium]
MTLARYSQQYAPGRTNAGDYVEPIAVADIINRRAAGGWTLMEKQSTDTKAATVLVFSRRVPWYESSRDLPPTPAPLPTPVPAATKPPAAPAPTMAPAARPPTMAPAPVATMAPAASSR